MFVWQVPCLKPSFDCRFASSSSESCIYSNLLKVLLQSPPRLYENFFSRKSDLQILHFTFKCGSPYLASPSLWHHLLHRSSSDLSSTRYTLHRRGGWPMEKACKKTILEEFGLHLAIRRSLSYSWYRFSA